MNIFQYTLYIFDLDGVIINSEPHHWKSYQHALKVCNLSNNQELTYKTYCKLKHSIDHNISFEHTYKEQYTQIYNEKKRHYYNNIDNVTLIDGFEDFLNTLLLKNKTVCLVTDSSKNGLNIIINKFPILKKIHYIVTRDDVKDRKPSSEGYLKVLNKCSNIGLSEIIGFEDSYKGFTALYRVVKNAVLVNNENYFYFDKIKPQLNMGYIYDYKNINNIYMTDKHVLDYLVISASGKGSRLLPLTAHIPKLLVTYNNNSLLNNIVSYWKNYTKKFVIIINEKYNTLVEFYLNMLDIEYEIINVELVNNYENSYTLHKALSHNRFLHKKILITWCDIYPKNKLSKEIFKQSNIIFTYKNYGRYEAHNNILIKKPYGNVIGIYYFSDFTYLNNFTSKMDLCDCYKDNFGDFTTHEIKDLVDIGDMDKLILFVNQNDQKYITRYFNEITDYDQDTLLKKSVCDYGNKIIKKESNFYKYHMGFPNIVNVYEFGENYFLMQNIKNSEQVITKFNKSLQYQQFAVLKKCLDIVEKLHNKQKKIVSSETLIRDINIEFKSKVTNRLKKITPILDYFSFIKKVNNTEIKTTHNEIIRKLSNNIITFLTKTTDSYCTIHGDCHLSNILVDNKNEYFLIDPRGYFGETSIFGINYYDIGKILYSLSGFDEINNRKNHYFIIEDNNIIVNINNNMDNYLSLFKNYNVNILIDMVILHWLGLAEYSKNNIHKCVSAYYYGIYLYQKYY